MAQVDMPAFSDAATIDGVTVSVDADEGTFPEGSTLIVERATAEQKAQAEATVAGQRDESQTIVSSYTFDISVVDNNGDELQPASGHTVNVSFTSPEVARDDIEAAVYHISGNPEDPSSNEAVASEPSATKLELAVDEDSQTITARSDGFSLYQVEFSYTNGSGTKKSFIFMGKESVKLSDILKKVGLGNKTVTEAPTFDPSDGFSAEQQGSDWLISSTQSSLTSSVTMTVVSGGKSYSIELASAKDTTSGSWENKDGVTMQWSYDQESDILQLSGSGALNMPGQSDDFGLDKTLGSVSTYLPEVPWKAFIDDVKQVVINDGVTSIGDQAFRKHVKLETITVNSSALIKLGKCAFYGDESLKKLDLSGCSNLTEIGSSDNEGPFIGCTSLEEVLLPQSLTKIPVRLFDLNKAKLRSVNLNELTNLTSIGKEAFKREYGSGSLEINNPDGTHLNLDAQTKLETIGKNAFRNQTGLDRSLTIGSPALTTIEEGAFSAYSPEYGVLESLDLSACSGLKTIRKEAFCNQQQLASIKFPDAYTWVDKSAFKNCTALSLPAASIAYCVGGNGALYNVNDDGSATKVLNDGEDLLYWIPTAIDDPTATSSVLPYTGEDQPLVNAPSLRPEVDSYSISYTLNGSATSGLPKAKDPGTYTVGYTVTLPDGTTKSGTINVTITPKSLADDMLSVDAATYEYDAAPHTPALTVKDGDHDLVAGADYTVDNTSTTSATGVGTYTIAITGKGPYTGKASTSWNIVDTTAPAITGVSDGAEYTEPMSFTVKDLRLATATLQKDSGEPQSLAVNNGTATGTAAEEGAFTIVATDPSGNTTTVSFTIEFPRYSITVENGTTDSSPALEGASVSIKADESAPGTIFDRWVSEDDLDFADASSPETTFTMPAHDVTVTATYRDQAAPEATLTFDLNGGTLDGMTGVFTMVTNVGETVTLPDAPTRNGYVFKFWKGSQYEAGASYEVEGDHTFIAEWEKDSESARQPSQDSHPSSPAHIKKAKALPATGDPMTGTMSCASAAACLLLAALVRRKTSER